MKNIEYKFAYIKRNDSGFITECGIRFFEGSVSTANEIVTFGGSPVPVTKYRRERRLQKIELPNQAGVRFKVENGNSVAIFFPIHFGSISTDDELRVFLNSYIALDSTRLPIDNQRN